MAWTEADKRAMDNAASDAEQDLDNIESLEAFEVVANWWAKWVMAAGHKRLGRILLQYKSKEGK